MQCNTPVARPNTHRYAKKAGANYSVYQVGASGTAATTDAQNFDTADFNILGRQQSNTIPLLQGFALPDASHPVIPAIPTTQPDYAGSISSQLHQDPDLNVYTDPNFSYDYSVDAGYIAIDPHLDDECLDTDEILQMAKVNELIFALSFTAR